MCLVQAINLGKIWSPRPYVPCFSSASSGRRAPLSLGLSPGIPSLYVFFRGVILGKGQLPQPPPETGRQASRLDPQTCGVQWSELPLGTLGHENHTQEATDRQLLSYPTEQKLRDAEPRLNQAQMKLTGG